jgi:uncharacterized membrane protein
MASWLRLMRGLPSSLVGRFALSQRWAGSLAELIQPPIRRAVGRPAVRIALDGLWLGAPLHPALTDIPVGSWTAALVLNATSAVTGDEALRRAADRALAVGTLAAIPAVVTGLTDLRDLVGESRQVAMVHALLNVIGLSLSSASLAYRRAGRRDLARGLSGTGFLVSSAAAHLGGMLSFRLGIRVNRTTGQTAPTSFVPTIDASELQTRTYAKLTSPASRSCLHALKVEGCPRSRTRARTLGGGFLGALCLPRPPSRRPGSGLQSPRPGRRLRESDGDRLDHAVPAT